MQTEATISAAKNFLAFVNASKSPWHAVKEARTRLLAAGFLELKERDSWDIKPKQKYFFTRNQSTLISFVVGGQYKSGNPFNIVAAHTDSPCLRVKPGSTITKHGYQGVACETYGGGLWHTWFDRDLCLAGRVITKGKEGQLVHNLVLIDRPILRIPTLCIHFNRTVNTDGFKFNAETELVPLLATNVAAQLESPSTLSTGVPTGQAAKHNPLLMNLLSSELGCAIADIMDFELCLADHQPAVIGGLLNEWIFAPRIDNLMMTFCGLTAIIEASNGVSLDTDDTIKVLSLYDHEEIGSSSAQGAESSLTEYLLRRLAVGGSAVAFEESVSKSFLISADMAHGLHPNYADKHEDRHRPQMHGGPVIKFNASQRYATNACTAALLREVAAKAGVPLQDMMVRNDSACGSTVGPILATGLAIRTVDIGNPQLSMHSIREMCDTTGVLQAIQLFKSFYENFALIDKAFIVD